MPSYRFVAFSLSSDGEQQAGDLDASTTSSDDATFTTFSCTTCSSSCATCSSCAICSSCATCCTTPIHLRLLLEGGECTDEPRNEMDSSNNLFAGGGSSSIDTTGGTLRQASLLHSVERVKGGAGGFPDDTTFIRDSFFSDCLGVLGQSKQTAGRRGEGEGGDVLWLLQLLRLRGWGGSPVINEDGSEIGEGVLVDTVGGLKCCKKAGGSYSTSVEE